jgi:hypothetical protein
MIQDQKDLEEIKHQKREEEHASEAMPAWEFGRGLKREGKIGRGVRG